MHVTAAYVKIETHAEYDTMDPVFNPSFTFSFTFMSDAYEDAALKQICNMNGVKRMEDLASNLADSYELIEDVVDYTDSDAYKSGELKDLNTKDTKISLDAEEYELPGAIESATPIGAKLVFERWTNAKGEEFGRLRMLYQSVKQLREGTMLSGAEAPMSVDLSLNGLKKNGDGLYSYDELRARIADAAAEYDELVREYGAAEIDQAA